MSLDMATGSRAHSLKVRGDDLYETPPVAVSCLIARTKLPNLLWEPASGRGAIVSVLAANGYSAIATDLVDYGLAGAASGVDFLMERRAPQGVSTIVTNPPFKLATEFVEHALNLCPHVHMLLRVAFLEGLRWEGKEMARRLERVMVFAPRLPMMHRDGWEGNRSNSGMAFAWFSWGDRQTSADPKIEWANWRTA